MKSIFMFLNKACALVLNIILLSFYFGFTIKLENCCDILVILGTTNILWYVMAAL